MGYFENLLHETNDTLAKPVTFVSLSPKDAALLRKEAARFFPGREEPHWDFPGNDAPHVHGEATRLWTCEFEPEQRMYLFFQPADEPKAFCFDKASDCERLLGECPNFEFWACDRPVTYLFCFNHHAYLMAWGRAAKWLRSRK